MKALAGVAAVAALFLLAAFSFSPSDQAEFDQDQVQTEALKVMEDFMEGFNELDMVKVVGTMHPDIRFPYAGRILNKDGYREYLEGWVETKESWEGRWLDTQVRVLSPDLAVFSGTYTTTIHHSDGRISRTPEGSWVTLVERTPDGWRWSLGGASSGGSEDVEGL
jgi:hypothetical protein